MGGINCPPPDYTQDKDTSGMYNDYTIKLAKYCNSLFSGISNFYAANAQIESAILGAGSLGQAVLSLKQSVQNFNDARLQLNSVASVWDLVSSTKLDFTRQMENIRQIQEIIKGACLELKYIRSNNIQKDIWDQSSVTKTFITATNALDNSIAWQIHFAKQTSDILQTINVK
jgi:hypothetical protein